VAYKFGKFHTADVFSSSPLLDFVILKALLQEDFICTSFTTHQNFACYLFHAAFLLGLYFDPEDGHNSFLRKIGWL
jgi:hypothetical protein